VLVKTGSRLVKARFSRYRLDHPGVPLLFPVAVFLSAGLLFFVEPMFARMVLPKLGGAPAVWNTCVAFYQVLLLAGYAYAHIIARRLHIKTQIVVHLMLLLVAMVWLPVKVGVTWTPGSTEHPSLTVIRWLVLGLGLPFFVLAASGPLLQQWSAHRHRTSSNPYRLYAASNAGSLVALLAYPVVIEPTLRLRAQSLLWTTGYLALVLVATWCGVTTWSAVSAPLPYQASHAADGASGAVVAVPWSLRMRWLALAFVPSSLMLSVTTFVSTDIAAIPLLWVVPLALYLVTLIVAFADRGTEPPTTGEALFPVALLATVSLIVLDDVIPARLAIPAHMGGFLVAAWACHRRLAALKPGTTQLTEFYLWIAAGGALGGAFNTFAAPSLFKTPLEYPVVAVAASVLLSGPISWPRGAAERARVGITTVVTTVAPALLVLVLSPLSHRVGWAFLPDSTGARAAIAAVPALVLGIGLHKHLVRLGTALALVMIAGAWVRVEDRITLHTERSFFGIHRVTDTGFTRNLLSGTTNHGSQAVNPALRCEPLSYYSHRGPVGQLFASLQPHLPVLRVGVVGLGTASIAAYARPGDSFTFFEVNPAVERLARQPDYFTYLRDCAPEAHVVLGDARLALDRVPDRAYDVLILDAFTSDAIPVHLMTTEAVTLYFRKLEPHGVLAMHISNRYLDLGPVISAIAQAQGRAAAVQQHRPDPSTYAWEASPSQWVISGRDRSDLLPVLASGPWREPVAAPGPLWTDDYSNVVRIIKW